jgi:hypothetical protein
MPEIVCHEWRAPDGYKADAPWHHEIATDCGDVFAAFQALIVGAERDPASPYNRLSLCRVTTRMTYSLYVWRERIV